MDSRGSRMERVKRIIEQFDGNGAGCLTRDEMASLVLTVNQTVGFTDQQIKLLIDGIFDEYYQQFIEEEKGLTCEGLLQIYDDGAGDLDQDFDFLGLEIDASSSSSLKKAFAIDEFNCSSSSIVMKNICGDHDDEEEAAAKILHGQASHDDVEDMDVKIPAELQSINTEPEPLLMKGKKRMRNYWSDLMIQSSKRAFTPTTYRET